MPAAICNFYLIGFIINGNIFDQTTFAGKLPVHLKRLFLKQLNLSLSQANDKLIQQTGNGIALAYKTSLFFGNVMAFIQLFDFAFNCAHLLFKNNDIFFKNSKLFGFTADLCGTAFHFILELIKQLSF